MSLPGHVPQLCSRLSVVVALQMPWRCDGRLPGCDGNFCVMEHETAAMLRGTLAHCMCEHSHNLKHTCNHASSVSGCLELFLLGGLYCSILASWLCPSWCLGMLHACVMGGRFQRSWILPSERLGLLLLGVLVASWTHLLGVWK